MECQMPVFGRLRRHCSYNNKKVVDSFALSYFEKTSFVANYAPANLTTEGMYSSIAKYGRDQPIFDVPAMTEALEWTLTHFKPHCASTIMSADDCILNMNSTSSAGYPANLDYKDKGEAYACPYFRNLIEDDWKEMSQVPVYDFWTCSQKKEIRLKEKVNKPRTFTASSAKFAVNSNRLGLDFNQRFYESAGKTWSFVGSTTYAGGFDRLYRRLNKHPHAFAADGSQYDASLFRQLLLGCAYVRWNCLPSSDRTTDNFERFRSWYANIIYSFIILEDGTITMKDTGNPSGSTNTVVDNTLCLFMLLAYSWIRLHKVNGVDTGYGDYISNVSGALNGDDNILTVSTEKVSLFNLKSIFSILEELNTVWTSDSLEPRQLGEVDFLSHTFVRMYDMWLPSPDYNRVISSLIYSTSVDDVRWSYLRASALRITSWGSLQCRDTLFDYLHYLDVHFPDKLVGDIKGIPIDEIRSLNKSDLELYSFYTGYECTNSSNLSPRLNGANSKIAPHKIDFLCLRQKEKRRNELLEMLLAVRPYGLDNRGLAL
jgi:hypothetical protein